MKAEPSGAKKPTKAGADESWSRRSIIRTLSHWAATRKRCLGSKVGDKVQLFYQDGGLIVRSFDDRDNHVANSNGFADLKCDVQMYKFIDHGEIPYLDQVFEMLSKAWEFPC